jgi:hypothetical protein
MEISSCEDFACDLKTLYVLHAVGLGVCDLGRFL